jgi:hypothetical protein
MDRTTARDGIYAFSKEQFEAVTTALLGAAGELRYQGVRDPSIPSNDKYWTRVVMQVADEYQETLRCDVRRFVTVGNVIIQFFAPAVDPNAMPNLDIITEQMRNGFRNYRSTEIEFTRPRINDNIPAEPNWLRANLVSDFAYRQFM